jgi:hypothetical protein
MAAIAGANQNAKKEVFDTCMQARGYMPRDADAPTPRMAPVPVTVTQHYTTPITVEAEPR